MGWHEEPEPGFAMMALSILAAAVIVPVQWARSRVRRRLTTTERLWRSVFHR